jgi:WD40 repeat protein
MGKGTRWWLLDSVGRVLASASYDKSVRVWDATSGEELLTLRGHEKSVDIVRWSPDGRRLVSGSGDGTVRVWDTTGGEQLLLFQKHERIVSYLWPSGLNSEDRVRAAASWSPDGRRLAGVWRDNSVRVLDGVSGRQILCLRGHEGQVEAVNLSPDGRRLASASQDNTVRVRDAASFEQMPTLRGPEKRISTVSWSPEGRRLAIASCDNSVRIWDADNCAELLILRGHQLPPGVLSWSPDGGRLASANDGVLVWDAVHGSLLFILRGHEKNVYSVSWSSDGRRLTSRDIESTELDWDIPTGACEGVEDEQELFPVKVQGEQPLSTVEHRDLVSSSLESRTNVYETELFLASSGGGLVWCSGPIELTVCPTSPRLFVGAVGNHVYLLRLEGEV